ncbi:unnamed protein product [Lymnaea stagnalis]|uniref:Testicular haploid expressed protein n=1 Tax=Lymnaea stagnalis TaxID=6523 RepID=A0AAV2I7Q7_LYMST
MASSETVQRLDILAQPRSHHPQYRQNRRSVYWVDKEPPRGGPEGHTVIDASPRVHELAKHKTADQWKPDRASASWPVSDSAKSSSASSRILQLSAHRNPHPEYSFDRSPEWQVNRSTLSASSTPRVEKLATPKRRLETYSYHDPYWGYFSPISENALRASCSARVESLSHHKDYHKDFKDARSIQWHVSDEALAAIASLRLQQLSRPPPRVLKKEDYDPYRIPSSALRAQTTPRLDELAMPIPRKVRTKRVI